MGTVLKKNYFVNSTYTTLKDQNDKQEYYKIDRILSFRSTHLTMNNLLINRNKGTPITILKISKNKFLFQNTCPFDAISVLIAMTYTDLLL